jgi:hypothetical protein
LKLDSNDAGVKFGADAYRAATLKKMAEIPSAFGRTIKPIDLLKMDTSADPNCLLGNRWICRCGACIWTGPSGSGKSALLMQAASLWACGFDFFGIRPALPLKSLIIQAENDDMDLADEFKGVVNGLRIGDHVDQINQNITILTVGNKYGPEFVSFLRSIASMLRPDLVWIDPLMTFLGGGISDDKIVTPFIRSGLDPVAKEFGFAYMIAHHIPKPRVDAKLSNWTTSDYSYAGMGSSELTNWPRAAMHLKRLEDTKYELMATKRGIRAGLMLPPITDEFGNERQQPPQTVIPIEWAKDHICWLHSQGQTENKIDLTDEEFAEVLSFEWDTKSNVIERMMEKGFSKSKSRSILEKIMTRNGLQGRVSSDGEKVCSTFIFKIGEDRTRSNLFRKLVEK